MSNHRDVQLFIRPPKALQAAGAVNMMTGGGRGDTMSCKHATAAALGTLLLAVAAVTVTTGQTKPRGLRTYETRYYVIHTDVGRDAAREAELRLTRMAEEYHRRTRDFSGEIRTKLPFYLFTNEADYHAAGGAPNTAGEYDPNAQALKTFTGGAEPNLATWYTVQHEGFHQFADHVVGRNLPIWANEGLAEYFGEALFTGDGFVAGVVPAWRMKRVRAALEDNTFMSLRELLALSHKQWNAQLSTTNYDHAWTLVQFLVHGRRGSRQAALTAFIRDTTAGADWKNAWKEHLGEIGELEAEWRAYWTELPDDPTADLYAEATLQTLMSFLARATARRQRFDSFDAFVATAERGELKSTESDWLPPALLKDGLTRVAAMRKDGGAFALVARAPRPPTIVFVDKGGVQMSGRFKLKGARVAEVEVERRTKS